MILYLDTSTPTARIWIGDTEYSYETDRNLARDLLSLLEESLQKSNLTWEGITGLAVFRGPGSFTGLRIGITVINTIAYSQQLPIVGTLGDNWRAEAHIRLNNHDDDKVILPYYDKPANVTPPKH